jgi:hypothetical protein
VVGQPGIRSPRHTGVVARVPAFVTCSVAVALGAGCTSSTIPKTQQTQRPSVPTAVRADAKCTNSQVRITETTNSHALRAEVTAVRFTNVSPRSCWLRGFARILLLDGHLRLLPTREIRELPNGAPTVTLAANGGHARTVFLGSASPIGNGGRCGISEAFRITAPGLTRTFTLHAHRLYCQHGKITATPVIQQPYGTQRPPSDAA